MQSEQKKVSQGLNSDVVKMCSNFLRKKQPSGVTSFFTESSYDEESKLIAFLRTAARKSTQQQLLDKMDSVILELSNLKKLSSLATLMLKKLQKLSANERTKERVRHEQFVLEQKISDHYAAFASSSPQQSSSASSSTATSVSTPVAAEGTTKELVKHIEIPNAYLCPITKEIMRDPVVVADGRSYEREAITRWLAKNNTSPVTQKVLSNHTQIENEVLRQQINEFLEKNPQIKVSEAESLKPGNVLLEPSNIQAGDVLLKYYDGSVSNRLVWVGNIVHQRKYSETKLATDVTHAAICLNKNGDIAEASGKGLRISNLSDDPYQWEVFRYKGDKEIVALAGDLAASLAIESKADKRSGRYDYLQAAASAFRRSEKISLQRAQEIRQIIKKFNLDTQKYYCSNFVVFVYALASQICTANPSAVRFAIDKDYRAIMPTVLFQHLKQDSTWLHVGYLHDVSSTHVLYRAYPRTVRVQENKQIASPELISSSSGSLSSSASPFTSISGLSSFNALPSSSVSASDRFFSSLPTSSTSSLSFSESSSSTISPPSRNPTEESPKNSI